MHIGTRLGERRIWIGMRDVFARKQRNGTISAMNILLCINVLVGDMLSVAFKSHLSDSSALSNDRTARL